MESPLILQVAVFIKFKIHKFEFQGYTTSHRIRHIALKHFAQLVAHTQQSTFIYRNATFLFQKKGSPDVTNLRRMFVPKTRTYIRKANGPGIVAGPRPSTRIISIIHTQRSLFFSHVHTRFVLCLRKGIYLWKRAISKTLRSAEWLKSACGTAKKSEKYIKQFLTFTDVTAQDVSVVLCFAKISPVGRDRCTTTFLSAFHLNGNFDKMRNLTLECTLRKVHLTKTNIT